MDTVLVEEEREGLGEGLGAGIAAEDLLAGQRETVFLNRDVETLDLLPEARSALPRVMNNSRTWSKGRSSTSDHSAEPSSP